jgi:hypothetical protein
MTMLKMMLMAIPIAIAATMPSRADDAKDPKRPSDTEINKLLIGKWEGKDAATGITGTIKYAKDGSFIAEGLVPVGNKKVEISTSGTWSVSSGTIVSTVTKSSRPRFAPVGSEVKEVVNAIDEKSVKFTRGAEQERVRTRVKE